MKINQDLAELIGAHIGDGSMGFYQNHFIISFAGHPIKDKDYIDWIAQIYSKYFGIKPRIRKWSRALGFQIFSKEIFDFFKSMGIPSGKKLDIDIPTIIKKADKTVLASCIRGVFDTDGTMYFEPKKTIYYPRIQLKITSERLASTINHILNEEFQIKSTLYSRRERPNWKISYFVELRGVENLRKWLKLIGFRNNRHMKKVKLWNESLNLQ